MGQASSTSASSSVTDVGCIQDEIIRHAKTLTEIATLSYDEFKESLLNINNVSEYFTDANDKRIIFAIKKGTDSTLLWRSTVRIACAKIDPKTRKVEQIHFLTLVQFLRVVKSFECRLAAARYPGNRRKSCEESPDGTSSTSSSESVLNPRLPTADMLLREVTSENCPTSEKFIECCICLERKPEVMLPCAHSYCMLCIEEWNVIHKTCPICRETLSSTDDTWVIPEVPGSHEMNEELCNALMSLSAPSSDE